MYSPLAHATLSLFLIAVLALAGCDDGAVNASDVTLTGTVTNTAGQPVSGVTVALSSGGTTSTDANGRYTLETHSGNHTLSVTGQGYTPHAENIRLDGNARQETRDAVIHGPNQVSGEVVSVQDGQDISSATAFFYRGGPPSPGQEPELLESVSGYFFNLSEAPDGTFYVCVGAFGFVRECRENVELRGGSVVLEEFELVPLPARDNLIVVVSWGAQPDDLDAHLTGPDGAGDRYHIGARNGRSADGVSFLYGGYSTQEQGLRAFETISISTLRDGMYRYSVMNWTDRDADPLTAAASIAGSPTRVRVYDSTGLIKEYHAPQGGIGNTWRVFELNGGTLTFSDNGGASLGYFIAVDQNDPIFLTGGGDGPDTRGATR
jgi:hypothetical protein